MSGPANRLYFGDCLDVMREDVPDDSVDLIYLDPPFNSKRLYNAFIGDAQWVAFNDTWRWHEAEDDFHHVAGQVEMAATMEGLRSILGESCNLAYVSYMANRLLECRRILKPTGSIYLHCDPTMSYLLRIVMDAIFGDSFLNEIAWRRTTSRSDAGRYGRITDRILFYADDKKTWHNQFDAASGLVVSGDRLIPLTGPGLSKGESGRPWKGYDPATSGKGRCWSVPKRGSYAKWVHNNIIPGYLDIKGIHDRLDALHAHGLITFSARGIPSAFRPAAASNPGPRINDLWVDIGLEDGLKDYNQYDTRKPVALLERIISSSSNEGDVVLDPFCGCGTAIHAASNLNRQWIGIDVCVNACRIIEKRLRGHFDSLWDDVEFIGFPKTRNDAKALASLDAFRFERWAASLVDGMEHNKIQRGDKGIDGRGRLAIRKGTFIDIVSQVKGGGTSPGDVQAFNGARQQAGADLGIFTCFAERVTPRMRDAAASAGRFMDVPTVQI
ncbi:MAG: site-specific DNA-methyltransferase [Acidimicrobiia bacterium]|nr:site-specific DNA-methyltransferase [Acidimicrobiia bacterium]